MMVDPDGYFPFFILTALIGVALRDGIDYATGSRGTDLIWWGIGGAVIGAVAGISFRLYNDISSNYGKKKYNRVYDE